MSLILTNGRTTGLGGARGRRANKKGKKRPKRNQQNAPGVRSARTLPRERRNYASEIISRDMPLFHNMKRMMLRYHDKFSQTTGVSAAANYVFSANGLYDPNITGTGHQPMGFDQMMIFYEHYVVEKSRITIQTRNNSTNYPLDVAIQVNPGTTTVTDYTTICEAGILVRDRLGVFPYDTAMKTLTCSCDIAKFGGVVQLLDNPEYQGTSAANPTEQVYYHISTWNPEDATQLTAFFEVTMEFVAWFREPRDASQSLSILKGKFAHCDETVDPKDAMIEVLSHQLACLRGNDENKSQIPRSTLLKPKISQVD